MHEIGDHLDPESWTPDDGGECDPPRMLDPVLAGATTSFAEPTP